MKILDVRVNWMLNFGNSPHLEVLVDRIPNMEEMRFQNKEWLWIAEKEGYVMYFAWRGPGNEGGFGGSHFTIRMMDGSEVVLKGPMSSGAYGVNTMGLGQVVDVSITDSPEVFHKGEGCFIGGAVTLDLIKESFPPGVELWPEGNTYIPTLVGFSPLESKNKLRHKLRQSQKALDWMNSK